MEAILTSCAGLDVHRDTVVVCVMKGELDKKPEKVVTTFATDTENLIKLTKYIESQGCSHVAMESTGVYWKPAWNILDGGNFELILANAAHIKNLPGRKTDVKDSEWIAQLLRSGLVPKSFVPEEGIRDLRDMTRFRKKTVQMMASEKNRIHKILQDANIKISTNISDIFGDTGRKVLDKLVNGEVITYDDMVEFTSGRGKGGLRKKIDEILDSLNGRIRMHHIKMLRYSFNHIEYLEKQIEEIEEELRNYTSQYMKEIELLDTIPGVDKNAAITIIAEIGVDMDVFPTAKQLSSWAGLSPGNNESAGKKKKGKIVKGNANLTSILCECAWAAQLTKNTRLSRTYWRYVKRMGKKKATVALANLILRISYHLIKNQEEYKEESFQEEQVREEKAEKRMIKKLEEKGYIINKA